MNLTVDSAVKYIAKPLTAGIVASVVTGYMHNPGAGLTVGGTTIPLWLLAGGFCVLGSEVEAVMQDKVIPHIPSITLLANPAETALNVGINAGSMLAAYNLSVGSGFTEEIPVSEVLIGSALAEVISGYASEKWWRPAIASYFPSLTPN